MRIFVPNNGAMSFLSDLRDLLRQPDHAEPDDRLTAAALLVLVAHADGRVLKAEQNGMRVLLRENFGLSDEQSSRLLEQAGRIGSDLDPATDLIDRIVQDIPDAERPRLLALAYRVAVSDGVVHEFEDGLIWRTGRRLGLSENEVATIKAGAMAEHALSEPKQP